MTSTAPTAGSIVRFTPKFGQKRITVKVTSATAGSAGFLCIRGERCKADGTLTAVANRLNRVQSYTVQPGTTVETIR